MLDYKHDQIFFDNTPLNDLSSVQQGRLEDYIDNLQELQTTIKEIRQDYYDKLRKQPDDKIYNLIDDFIEYLNGILEILTCKNI